MVRGVESLRKAAMRRGLRAFCVLFGTLASPAWAESPKPIDTPAPQYPAWAIGSGISTEVELRVRIGSDGHVRQVEMVPYDVRHDLMTREMRASFDTAAVRSVRTWIFRPASHDGRRVAVWWTLRVPFADPEDTTRDPADSVRWIADTSEVRYSPDVIEHPAPEWPAAVPYGCRGRLTVRLFPGPDGRVSAARVVHSTLGCGDASLVAAADEAAIQAALHWRYRAGQYEGEPILADFPVPSPRLDAPVVVGCVRDSLSGKLRPDAEIFGRDAGHPFGRTDETGWFVLRGAAAGASRLRADARSCSAGGLRSVRPWKHPGDELTLYTHRCGEGKR